MAELLLSSTRLLTLIFAVFVSINCTGVISPKIGEVYLYKSETGVFRVAKVIDIKDDRLFLCIFTDTDIINVANYGNCLDYGLAYQKAFMTEDEKKDALGSLARYKERLPDNPTSYYKPMKAIEFHELKPTYLRNSEITDEDKRIANQYWTKTP